MRIEFREIGQRIAPDAMVHLRGVLEMHPAQASAEWAALIEPQISPFPNAEIFGNGVAIISDDLEGVGMLGDEPIAAGALENGKDVRWINGEPLAAHTSRAKMSVEAPLDFEGVSCLDPSEQTQFQGIAGLEVAGTRLDILRYPDLDRGASVFILANEIDRYVRFPALSEPVEKRLDHSLV